MAPAKTYGFDVGSGEAGQRLDRALAGFLADVLSRSGLQKLIEGGAVRINGALAGAKNYRLALGDRVEVEVPEAVPAAAGPEAIPLSIVYEDEDLLVVDKPRGMVVHPAPGNYTGTLVNAILHHCGDRLSSINGVVRPGIVHRIDKDTSGLLVVAKNDRTHKSLAGQLAAHTITRRYQAIVYGSPKEEAGTVDAPIGRDPKNRLRMAVTPQNSKPAVTHYRILEHLRGFTHIEARLETGRTHQIRVHMAYLGHPLLGDPVYGPKKPRVRAEGQMLHAMALGFRHPATGDFVEFESPLPPDFTAMLAKLR